jgi:hypothetical protein
MHFQLFFDCDNAAFEEAASETARILRDIAERVEGGRLEGRVMDVNGNSVGNYAFLSTGSGANV